MPSARTSSGTNGRGIEAPASGTMLFCIALALSGCAKAPGAEPPTAPTVQARMLTPEQAAAAAQGERPAENRSVFQDVLPPPDWMSTDWVVSSP